MYLNKNLQNSPRECRLLIATLFLFIQTKTHTIPGLTTDMAVRNWHRRSCLLRISWMFSCPSTENPWRATHHQNISTNHTIAIFTFQPITEEHVLPPSAIKKCRPRPSVLSRIKLRNAVMFSGRVMSPSPSIPPSPETPVMRHSREIHNILILKQIYITRLNIYTTGVNAIGIQTHFKVVKRVTKTAFTWLKIQ